ncbi:PhyH-domain-containing protein [Aspergillus leporis]|jgi:ectoine hydroxylase-related dioxygenase (phytanoyl-CoA dioxygenase family)|uniref:PhyH-domain-containing protein n=1 Tax=Aspergillus leporis TaxID=41062 RepID=A0A5N5X4R3_9EURO|nr:PhyH-domain-containing protein [Aspergillus leporis]
MTVPTTEKVPLRRMPMSAGTEAILSALQEDGCVIIQGFLSSDQVNNLNSEVDPHLKEIQLKRSTYQEDHLVHMKRKGHLALISKTFRKDLLNHNLMHEICKKTFGPVAGDYWMTVSSVLEIGPGYKGQKLHREQDGIPICNAMGKDCPEAMLNFLVALTEFTSENGATCVIPRSHTWEDFSNLGSPEQTVPAEMDAGDAVLFSGKMVHGAGQNQTANFHRRALPLVMQAGYFTPVEASVPIPRPIVESMTPLAQKMLGWRSVRCNEVELWSYNMNELGEGLGLKSSQPLQDVE